MGKTNLKSATTCKCLFKRGRVFFHYGMAWHGMDGKAFRLEFYPSIYIAFIAPQKGGVGVGRGRRYPRYLLDRPLLDGPLERNSRVSLVLFLLIYFNYFLITSHLLLITLSFHLATSCWMMMIMMCDKEKIHYIKL